MWAVTWKGLLAHKLRLALTAVAIVLGVGFVAGTFVLTDSLGAAFEGLFTDISAGTDAYVNPRSAFEAPIQGDSGPLQEGNTIPEVVLEQVRSVDGVAAADGYVQGLAILLTRDGEVIGGNGPPQFGFSVPTEVQGANTLREGTVPTGPGEVTIDLTSAAAGEYGIGDTIDIVTDGGRSTYEIVGITGFGAEDNLLGATIASFTLETARDLFGKPGVYDQISVVAADGVNAEDLVERLNAALGDDVEAVTAASEQQRQLEDVQGFLGFFNTALLAFAGIALFVGAFIIANTFSIVVTQRTREYALLRALGASARQVTRSVVAEAAIIGVLSSLAGLLTGVGLAAALRGVLAAFGADLPDGGTIIAMRTVVVSLVVGVTITVISALLPARRAAKVAPVEAMRGTGEASEGSSQVRTIGGGVALLAGFVLLAVGLIADVPDALSFVGGGAALTMLGVAMLAPLVAGPFVGVFGPVIARRGVTGMLARENARRNPKRTATTAAALMIGLALVSFVSILAASITSSVSVALDEQFRADYIMSPGTQGPPTPIPASLVQELTALPETGAVVGVRYGPALVDGDPVQVAGVEMSSLEDVAVLDPVEGSLADVGVGAFAAHEELADAEGWSVGDDVAFEFLAGGSTSLRLAAIYRNQELVGTSLLVDVATYADNFTNQGPLVMYVNAADGFDPEVARTAIEAVVAQVPNIALQDQATFREEQSQAIGQILNLMVALLMFALVIALIGITNTMALSVFERTRELGLLRAVGMTGRQVKKMVRGESAIVAAFGGLLGVVVGTFFGWAVVTALADDGLEQLTIPFTRLAVYLVVAAFAGIVAGSFPARRAAKLDVLAAVTTE